METRGSRQSRDYRRPDFLTWYTNEEYHHLYYRWATHSRRRSLTKDVYDNDNNSFLFPTRKFWKEINGIQVSRFANIMRLHWFVVRPQDRKKLSSIQASKTYELGEQASAGPGSSLCERGCRSHQPPGQPTCRDGRPRPEPRQHHICAPKTTRRPDRFRHLGGFLEKIQRSMDSGTCPNTVFSRAHLLTTTYRPARPTTRDLGALRARTCPNRSRSLASETKQGNPKMKCAMDG